MTGQVYKHSKRQEYVYVIDDAAQLITADTDGTAVVFTPFMTAEKRYCMPLQLFSETYTLVVDHASIPAPNKKKK